MIAKRHTATLLALTDEWRTATEIAASARLARSGALTALREFCDAGLVEASATRPKKYRLSSAPGPIAKRLRVSIVKARPTFA